MRKTLLILCLLSSVAGLAQDKLNPVIKKGTRFSYSLTASGQTMPFSATIDSISADYLKLGWYIDGMGTGGWIMNKKSLESALFGYWNQPTVGTDEVLPDNTTVLILSKAQWNSLTTTQKVNYSGALFTVKSEGATPVKAGGKILDAIQLVSPDGNTKLWVLNNPSFPALVKVEGNPHQVDLEITSIE